MVPTLTGLLCEVVCVELDASVLVSAGGVLLSLDGGSVVVSTEG
jgi:hypothetical protein